MYPELLRINTPEFLRSFLPEELVVQSYGAVIVLGVIFIYHFLKSRVKKYGISGEELSNIIFYTFIAAFIGGKLFYYLQEPTKYIADPSRMMKNMGSGFVFYGSLIFAIPTIVYMLKRKSVPIREFLDILAFVGPIIHSFGRLGCFLAGCCYGLPWEDGPGVVFRNPLTKARPMDIPLYPTQLFDIAVNVGILIVLIYIAKKKRFQGQLFLVYIMMYGVGRSIVELFRGDSERGYILDLITHSQLIAVILIGMCLYLWRRWSADPLIHSDRT